MKRLWLALLAFWRTLSDANFAARVEPLFREAAAGTDLRVLWRNKDLVATPPDTWAALKQAAEAWLPKEIIYRPKASFSAPLRAWVRNDLRDVINDTLVNGELTGAGMLRPAALNRLIEAERAGREDNAKQIWQLLSMELWYRNARSMGVAA